MNDMPKPYVSVIIPNLNSPIIDKTIDSIKKQTFGVDNLEIVIVGKDKYNLIQPDNIVKSIETEEILNPAQARNLAVKNSKGEILCFIDADCIADKDWLKKHLLIHENEIYGAVGGAVLFPSDDYWSLCDNISCFHFMLPDRERGLINDNVLGTLNFSMKRKVFVEMGGFDEALPVSEDHDLVLRLKKKGYNIGFEPEAVVIHDHVRNYLRSILNHSSQYARGFIALQKKYPDIIINKELFRSNKYLLFCISPLKSLYFSIRLFYQHPIIAKYWYAMPGVFLFKLAWYYAIFREKN